MKCIECTGKNAQVKIGYQEWLFICTGRQGYTFNKLLAGLRLSGMTFLFCNRHLWVYDSTEIQGHATVLKKTGTNFL